MNITTQATGRWTILFRLPKSRCVEQHLHGVYSLSDYSCYLPNGVEQLFIVRAKANSDW
jgi:hypothetical protein